VALEIDFDFRKLKRPIDLKPYLHQVDACKWVLTRKNSYLAMEAGTGKTITSALCMNADQGPTIIICPKFLVTNWVIELSKWLVYSYKLQVIESTKSIVQSGMDIYLMPTSLMHVMPIRNSFFKMGIKFKWVIVDESHYFKSFEAKRTKSLFGGRIHANHKWYEWQSFHSISERMVLLSGTPMPNRPMELWPALSTLAPDSIDHMSQHFFGVKFCGGRENHFGWEYKGACNTVELHRRMTNNFMFVKELKDCVDLPEKLPTKYIYLADNRGERLVKKEEELYTKLDLERMLATSEVQDAKTLGELATLRREIGFKKLDQASQIINDMCKEGEPLLVFAWHNTLIELLGNYMGQKFPTKVITGSTPTSERQSIVESFQNGLVQVLICNIKAAGVGVTLTKSNRVVFVEPSWVPADNEQAIARVHRIGQTRSVQATFLVYPGSLDHKILESIKRKQLNINSIIHGGAH